MQMRILAPLVLIAFGAGCGHHGGDETDDQSTSVGNQAFVGLNSSEQPPSSPVPVMSDMGNQTSATLGTMAAAAQSIEPESDDTSGPVLLQPAGSEMSVGGADSTSTVDLDFVDEEMDEPSDAEVAPEGLEEPGAPQMEQVVVLAADIPLPIPASGSSGTLTSSSEDAPNGVISSVEVHIDIAHSCTKDLTGTLRSPIGTEVVLFALASLPVCSADIEGTVLDDNASLALVSGRSPFSGEHRPTGQLSDLIGENAAGVWQLEIVDDTIGDRGTLTNWSVRIGLE